MFRSLMAWASLMRLANGMTAMSNILAAYFLLSLGLSQWIPFPMYLIPATLCLYYGGMILNDVFDLEKDRIERPERPLPRGLIDPMAARLMGFYLLLAGLAFAYLQSAPSALVGGVLVVFIIVYDGFIKQGVAGSLVMGLCRYANWYLGLTAIFYFPGMQAVVLNHGASFETGGGVVPILRMASVGMPVFFYVFALTVLSKEESRAERKWPLLVTAVGLMASAGSVFWLYHAGILVSSLRGVIPLLAGLFYLLYRLYGLWKDFEPEAIQKTIKFMVLGIIPLDALLVLSAGSVWLESFLAALSVLLLLWPARALAGRFTVT